MNTPFTLHVYLLGCVIFKFSENFNYVNIMLLTIVTMFYIRSSFLIAQLIKNPPVIQETLVRFLGRVGHLKNIGYPLQYSWASLVAQLVKNLPAMWRPGFDPWVGKIPWRRERLLTPVFWPGEFHVSSVGSQRVGRDFHCHSDLTHL